MWAFPILCTGVAANLHAQCQYEVTIIQDPTLIPRGTGIDNLGHAVGYYFFLVGDTDRAFLWTPQAGLITLQFPPGTSRSFAHDVNDAGQIVGSFDFEPVSMTLGFLRDGETFIDMGTLPGGTFSEAFSINESGQVAGTWGNNVMGPQAAFLWQDGVMTDLSPELGTPNSSAYDINESGQIVGWMGDSQFNARAFIWEEGAVTDLGVIPGGLTGEGRAINSLGQVAGQGLIESPEDGSLVLHAVLWNDTEAIDLGTLPGTTFSRAVDVNAHAQVVGFCNNHVLIDLTAFVWQAGVMTDLNDVISPDIGMIIQDASAINELGQIVGRGITANGNATFLLTPVDVPVGDLDGDCTVGIIDFLELLSQWGPCTGCDADLDGDGVVGVTDFLLLLTNWG